MSVLLDSSVLIAALAPGRRSGRGAWHRVLTCRRHGQQMLFKAVPIGRQHPVTRVTNQHQGTDFITCPVRVS